MIEFYSATRQHNAAASWPAFSPAHTARNGGAARPLRARSGPGVNSSRHPAVASLAESIRYALSRWEGLTRFIDDGRIEIDSNVVERTIRPIALNRKNALFAGSDGGGDHWAIIASLMECLRLLADQGKLLSKPRFEGIDQRASLFQ